MRDTTADKLYHLPSKNEMNFDPVVFVHTYCIDFLWVKMAIRTGVITSMLAYFLLK